VLPKTEPSGRDVHGAAVLDDEWISIADFAPEVLDFGARFPGTNHQGHAVLLEAVQSLSGFIVPKRRGIEQGAVQFREHRPARRSWRSGRLRGVLERRRGRCLGPHSIAALLQIQRNRHIEDREPDH